MAEENVVVAVDVDDLDPEKIMISPVMTKSWSYKHKETGEPCKGSYPYVHVYYEKPKQQFVPQIKNVRTNGIQTSSKYQSLFLSANLTEEQSKMMRSKIDDRIAELLFDVRKDLLKGYSNLSKITKPADVSFIMAPFVKDGQPKPDDSGDKYDDQITTTVPSKKVNKQVVVNSDVCTIEDINGKPYSWAGINGNLAELAIGVLMIKYDEQIKYVTEARVITPTEPSRAKVVTKRKLDQAKESKVQAKKQAPGAAKPAGKQMQSRTKTETKPAVSAFNNKLKPVEAEADPEEAQDATEEAEAAEE